MSSIRLFRAAAITAATLTVAACGGDSSTAPTPTPSVAAPRLDESSCPYKLDSSQTLGTTVRCGVLIAPQDRRNASGATVRIPFAVFKSASPSSAVPVFYLLGGPGETWSDAEIGGVRAGQSPNGGTKLARDEVVLEQRGSVATTPALTCPGIAVGPEWFRDWANALAAAVPGWKSCAANLTAQGALPENVYTDALAADVEDLRRLLGYDKIAVNGTSYGTQWALAVLRNYPNRIDRVVLDSVANLSFQFYKTVAEGRDAAFMAVAAACAAQPECASAYPDLDERVSALLTALDANPVAWKRGPYGELNAAVVAGTLELFAAAAPGNFPRLVALIEELVDAGVSADTLPAEIQDVFSAALDESLNPAEGQYLSILCADTANATAAEVGAATSGVRPSLRPAAQAGAQTLFTACQSWPYRKDLSAGAFTAVVSDVPVLLLSGALDPLTPPVWAEQAAKTLSKGTVVRFPARGHSIQQSSACARSLVGAFLAGQPVDPSCAAEERVEFE